MEETSRAHVFISGRVQGVFFRAEAAQRARTRGVGGWARNLRDGRVEALFEGPREAVESMVEWCRRGPSLAEVTSIEVAWEEPTGEESFRAV
ncbi:MAG: acylphosphatase [Actinomycetota bacterium]